jgi:hypothetical protein
MGTRAMPEAASAAYTSSRALEASERRYMPRRSKTIKKMTPAKMTVCRATGELARLVNSPRLSR